jgi:phosphoesterase RecJ-like protein
MDYKKIESIIADKDKIFISSHINPDGDSLGICSGSLSLLNKTGKRL